MPWKLMQSTEGRVVLPRATARYGPGFRLVDMEGKKRSGGTERNSGKTTNRDKWNKCRKEKGKRDPSREVATTAANGDIQHEIAPPNEKGLEGSVTRVGCRGIQQSTAQKGTQKGSQNEKGKNAAKWEWGTGK